jgi:RNA polymerase sigma-70 factor, ECF subfamily
VESSQSESQLTQQQVQAIYDEFAVGLKRFLLGVLKEPSVAEDAFQLSFVRLVEKGHLVQAASIKSWLYQVAFNEAMLFKRRQSTGQRHQEPIARHFLASDRGAKLDDPENMLKGLIQEENVERVKRAFEELSEVQKTVVQKRIYEGKKFREIAEELNVPLATVLARMQSSLKKLQPLLEDPSNDF